HLFSFTKVEDILDGRPAVDKERFPQKKLPHKLVPVRSKDILLPNYRSVDSLRDEWIPIVDNLEVLVLQGLLHPLKGIFQPLIHWPGRFDYFQVKLLSQLVNQSRLPSIIHSFDDYQPWSSPFSSSD